MHSFRWPHFLPPLAASFPASALPGPSALAKHLPPQLLPSEATLGRHYHTCLFRVSAPHSHSVWDAALVGSIWRRKWKEGLRSEAMWAMWASPPNYHAPRAGPLSIWENLLKLPHFFFAQRLHNQLYAKECYLLFISTPSIFWTLEGNQGHGQTPGEFKTSGVCILFLSQAASIGFNTGKIISNICLDFFSKLIFSFLNLLGKLNHSLLLILIFGYLKRWRYF